MPFYTGGPIGPNPEQVSLDDFKSSVWQSTATAIEDTFKGNPTTLAYDWLQLKRANDGDRLDQHEATMLARQSGVTLDVPESGYTAAALSMLVQRKQDEIRRADIMARAPGGFLPTTTRIAAQLATGLTDPLNIAAGFIPVVGEARYASMLARAGESAVSRLGTRVAVGAAEGAVGVGAMEPLAYGMHQQLQDDYHMTDSLMNVAFGAALGGALHGGGGLLVDALRGGANPSIRFRDLSVDDVQGVMNFERQRAEMPAADQARVLDSFSLEQRRAVEEGPGIAQVHAPEAVGDRPLTSAAQIHDNLSPEIKASAMRSAVADMMQGRLPDVENIVRLDPAGRIDGALPTTMDAVRAGAERQASPEAVAMGDFFAARAEDQRLKDSPKTASAPVEAAEAEAAKASERLESVRKNLEQSGMAPEKLQAALDEMKPFEEARNDAKALGDAARAAALCGVRA